MRVLLKITGESILSKDEPIDYEKIKILGNRIKSIHEKEIELGIVIGGGNLFRGKDLIEHGFAPFKSHYIGMLATIMNALAIEEVFSTLNIPVKIFSAVDIPRFISFFSFKDVDESFKRNNVCIFAGGTGNPFFTTDSAAALRALESRCDLLIKATKVDGVYTNDPLKFDDAKKLDFISYDNFLENRYGIMDLTAIDLCKQGKLPVIVCSLFEKNNIENLLLKNKRVGTLIYQEDIWPIS
jgi:uridylate kinase